MTDITKVQIAEEGPRNAVVKLTGVLDTANVFDPGIIKLTAGSGLPTARARR